MDIILGRLLATDQNAIKIYKTEIGVIGEFKPEHAPFPSFTFTRKQLQQLKVLIDKELEEGNDENI